MKKQKTYFAQRDYKNSNKIYEMLDLELPEFCREYCIGIENNTTALTRLNYMYDIKLFLKYITSETKFVGKAVKQITLSDIEGLSSYDIEKYLSYLSYYENAEGKSISNGEKGKARKLSSIRALIKFFIRKEMMSKDPTAPVRLPKIHEKEIVRLEGEEIVSILESAETGIGLSAHQLSYHKNTSVRDVAIVALLLGTGIRISELVGLDVKDIDFDNASFIITRKGGNRVVLYFSQEIGGILADYSQLRKNQKEINQDAFFLSLQNKRISTRSVENIVKKYSQIASPLKKISPHKLRSTYGTELYRQTGDIYIVADVLGHKDVNTTKKHYAAISDDVRRKASKQVVLRKPNSKKDD
ncbi:MAG: tyrosine-type recombinase/integrase [Clostridia bacterium]